MSLLHDEPAPVREQRGERSTVPRGSRSLRATPCGCSSPSGGKTEESRGTASTCIQTGRPSVRRARRGRTRSSSAGRPRPESAGDLRAARPGVALQNHEPRPRLEARVDVERELVDSAGLIPRTRSAVRQPTRGGHRWAPSRTRRAARSAHHRFKRPAELVERHRAHEAGMLVSRPTSDSQQRRRRVHRGAPSRAIRPSTSTAAGTFHEPPSVGTRRPESWYAAASPRGGRGGSSVPSSTCEPSIRARAAASRP
jgi:hypothetical protein